LCKACTEQPALRQTPAVIRIRNVASALLLPLLVAACGSSKGGSASAPPSVAAPSPSSASAASGAPAPSSGGADLYGITKQIALAKGGLQPDCQRLVDADLPAPSGIGQFRRFRCFYSGEVSHDIFDYYRFTDQQTLDSNVDAYKGDPGAVPYLVDGFQVILPNSTTIVGNSDLYPTLAQQVHDTCGCGEVRQPR
jgi:hypothetical protein